MRPPSRLAFLTFMIAVFLWSVPFLAYAAPGVTFTVLYSATDASGTMHVVRAAYASGDVQITQTFVSSTNEVAVTTVMDGWAQTVLLDGTISASFQPDGSSSVTMEPDSGPMWSGQFVGGELVHSSGNLELTAAAMPLVFSGSLGQNLVDFGLSQGGIKQATDGTYFVPLQVLAQWGGTHCNRATAKSVFTFIAAVGTIGSCARGNEWACRGSYGVLGLLYMAIADEWEICGSVNN